jgi:hypothetical protein
MKVNVVDVKTGKVVVDEIDTKSLDNIMMKVEMFRNAFDLSDKQTKMLIATFMAGKSMDVNELMAVS